MEPIEMRGQNQRRQPFAEARGHVQRAQRTVTQQMDALQRAAQLVEQRVHLFARVSAASRHQRRHRGPVTANDGIETFCVRVVPLLGEARARYQLVGDALKRRHHDDHGFGRSSVENDLRNGTYGRRGSER